MPGEDRVRAEHAEDETDEDERPDPGRWFAVVEDTPVARGGNKLDRGAHENERSAKVGEGILVCKRNDERDNFGFVDTRNE